MKITNLFKNEKQLYSIRLTQEGALKFITILNQMIPSEDLGIVTTMPNAFHPDECWMNDVIIQAKLSPKKFEIINELISDYVVNVEVIGENKSDAIKATVWK